MENKFTVEFYEKENGEKPCLKFLNTLEVKLRAKAFRDLALLELKEALNEQMKDESFKKEYEALGPEYEIISSLIDARKACNVTQKQLSETTGIAQSDISKIENGSGNPTIKILKRLAEGLGMNLKIEFTPKSQFAMN